MFLLLSANSEYSEALESMQEQTITQAQYVNQTSIKDIYTHCYQIQQNSNMNKILYGDSFDPALNMEALEINKNFCISSSLIHSCYFINFRTGTVIDQSGRTDIDYHADSGIYEILGDFPPAGRRYSVIPGCAGGSGTILTAKSLYSALYFMKTCPAQW